MKRQPTLSPSVANAGTAMHDQTDNTTPADQPKLVKARRRKRANGTQNADVITTQAAEVPVDANGGPSVDAVTNDARSRKLARIVEQGKREKNRSLTRCETKVLDALMDPATCVMKKAEIARIAGCHPSTLHGILADPWFEEQRKRLMLTVVRHKAAAFVEAASATALTPGRDGFQDRRMLLTMAGDFVPRQQHQVSVTGRVLVGVIGVNMDEL